MVDEAAQKNADHVQASCEDQRLRVTADQMPGFDPDEVLSGFETPADPFSGKRRALSPDSVSLMERLLQMLGGH
ncbi:MAG: hypothetical protein ABI877_00700 [Gemmatimonadaceae bacterium]